jgi:hypothetical protein
MEALGRLFDIGLGWAPVDMDTADAATGKRLSMANAGGVTFVVATGTGGANDIVFDVNQHTAYTGGTTADLDSVVHWYIKAETALDNDESWVEVTQSAASECTVVGATYGAQQKLVAIEVDAAQLSDGYGWVSLNMAMTSSTSQLGVCLYILHDLHIQRKPTLLGNLLNPGAANA